MVECTFKLNGKPMSTFEMNSLKLPAFSGLDNQVNRREFICSANTGPIPPGVYYLLDRQSGGTLGALRDVFTGRSDWFALYAADGNVDDEFFCDRVKRGNFRLHPKGPAGISRGCITIEREVDFNILRAHIKATTRMTIPNSTLTAYGRVTVT